MRHHTAAMRIGRQPHLAEIIAGHARNVVHGGQALVEHGPLGVHEIEQTEVVLQHFLKEELRLLRHRPEQEVIEVAVEFGVGDGEIDFAQIEPLAGEVLGETMRAR